MATAWTDPTLTPNVTKSKTAHITEIRAAVNALENTRAPSISPVFTGTPTAPTPATAASDTTLATTAFIKAQAYLTVATGVLTTAITDADITHAPNGDVIFHALALKAPLASPVLTGAPTAPTPATADSSTTLATTAFVKNQSYVGNQVVQTIRDAITITAPSENAVFDALALKATLASPALTGTPTAPTPATADTSTNIATAAFVKNQSYVTNQVVQTIRNAVTITAPSEDAVFDALALKATYVSPALTGIPTAPTAVATTNTIQVATTAFVKAQGYLPFSLFTAVSDFIVGTGTGTAVKKTAAEVLAILGFIKGSSTFAGSLTARTIAHGLGVAPSFVSITPSQNSNGYLGEVFYTADATNIYVYNGGTAITAFTWFALK